MQSIHVPGFVWTIVIALSVIAVQQYVPSPWGEVGVVVGFGIIKALNLDAELAQKIIQASEMRSANMKELPPADNKVMRFMIK